MAARDRAEVARLTLADAMVEARFSGVFCYLIERKNWASHASR